MHEPADIALPTIGSICETPEFAPHSPRINVTVVVFAWRRLASLRRVVDSLLEAEGKTVEEGANAPIEEKSKDEAGGIDGGHHIDEAGGIDHESHE